MAVMARHQMRVATVALIVLAGAACATTSPRRIRPSTIEEARLVNAAVAPLLAELAKPALHREDCKIALGIIPTPRINASVGRGKPSACTTLTLLVTEGALSRLPEPMLRAVLAHELGHVVLQHGGRNTRAHEAAADEFAVKLLKRLEPRYLEACVQLVYVFSVLGQHGALAAPWFAAHPSPERRAETALEGCNR
jgi:Zn-dependent protease with chaperone function